MNHMVKSVNSLLPSIAFIRFLLICITIFSFCPKKVRSQNFDYLMVKRAIRCEDIALNAYSIVESYYNQNKLDSLDSFVKYWDMRCSGEAINKVKLLLLLTNDSIKDPDMITWIYRDLMYRSRYPGYTVNQAQWRAIQPLEYLQFVSFLQDAFQKRAKVLPKNSQEYLIADAYGNRTNFADSVQLPKYKDTEFQELYFKGGFRRRQEQNPTVLQGGIVTGIWIPTGKLSKLGIHPELGYYLGIANRNFMLDFTIAFKFLNSPNEYNARRNRTDSLLEKTRHFFGGYIGLDYSYTLINKSKNQLLLNAGIAVDGFDILEEDKDKSLKTASIWAINKNFGLTYRRILNRSTYLMVSAKYNWVNYANSGLIDLTGNPISIQVRLGFCNFDGPSREFRSHSRMH